MLGMFTSISRQQAGVALITMLLLVALLTAIVSRMALSSTIWMRQVGNISDLAQADQASRAAQFWLARLLEEDTNGFDAQTDTWAQAIPPVPFNGGEASAWIEDMQSRFNVNNLVNSEGKVDLEQREYFTRLLRILELDPAIADAVADWIDRDSEVSGPRGAEEGYYLGQATPYITANRPVQEIAELRMVRGLHGEAYERLAPHVTALPFKTTVNLNTASSVVLAAMVTAWGPAQQSLGQAQRWSQRALLQPATKIEDFIKHALNDSGAQVPAILDISSAYFMAHIRISKDEREHRTAVLFYREQGRSDIIWHARELN